ncbi:CcoQ/FixQ family Cbb3-type cytochrome c oxidase assembly chaperone [Riemerella columbina]|uniref:CcoQ/FixQ family Cbb3-type cytochrome c oxidase assembly chaperone n=1 Tax=Riemerella columbina TaxID=103810 RepID=UPI0026708695|nr:CcoQ/FixQ family Cbb3-type cytochrome c oxidase assembly chaperone [Riemerella columbina]WKS95631.1 CcoQ/FixQ family Cbb3-type cytochrome c oxidase assembly chaperone [Riemerella columbina]
MIPQNFKDILSNSEGTGFYQTLALLLFILFFGLVVYYVMSKPKKYYEDEANAPLDDQEKQNKF